MNKSVNGNMYEVTLDTAWEMFDAFLSGARTALVCVVSSAPLDEAGIHALNSSAEALGYGRRACTFAAVEELDAQALFLLVEALDPLCVIATDKQSAAALGQAYRCEVSLGKTSRVFGRTCVAFDSFSTMLANPDDKQVAWALLKKLPKYAER